jgi:hypothetical protein
MSLRRRAAQVGWQQMMLCTIAMGLCLVGVDTAAGATVQYENTTAINIPAAGDATPYPSTITVAGVPGNITKVTVTLLGFVHDFTPDPRILLVGPDGTTSVFLMGAAGDSTAITSPGVDITLDDDAASPLPCFGGGTPLTTGSFRPNRCSVSLSFNFGSPAPSSPYGSTMSVFNGMSGMALNGTWSLYATDPETPPGADAGSISGGWRLTIETDAALAVQVVSARGSRYQDGSVQVQWQTSEEVDHLGFRLYRDAGHGSELITPGLVAGSALAHGGAQLQTNLTYGWWDHSAAPLGALSYWLEAVDMAGHGSWYGPIVPQDSGEAPPTARQAPLLADVGSLSTPIGQSAPVAARRLLSASEAGDHMRQLMLAGQAGIKLNVRQAGWYRVLYEDLVAVGFGTAIEPQSLRLFAQGREVALQVNSAAVEFYAEGLETPSTDQQVYWLSAGGRRGRQVPALERAAEPGGARSYTATMTWRPRTIYFAGLKNGEAENFFGPPILSEASAHALTLSGIDMDASVPVEVEVAVQGVSFLAHTVQVSLNGSVLGQINLAGQAQGKSSFVVAPTLLREGENTLVFQALGGSEDVSLLDHVQIRYQRTYTAAGDVIHAAVDGSMAVQTLAGFSSPDIRVFDVTQPQRPLELIGTVTQENGGYAVSVALPEAGPRVLYAMTEAQIQKPLSLGLNTPSRWLTSQQQADLIIVTHSAFAEAAQTLGEARQAEGLAVVVVDIEDIYDELNFGHPSPDALKRFLQHAWATWQPQPRFVLLFGDASYDPRNYLGSGVPDYVPTKLTDTALMETASDDWLVDFTDDSLPELALGRLPVRTEAAAQRLADKLVQYNRRPPTASPHALLVADDPDVYNFEQVTAAVRSDLPSSMGVTEVRRRESGDRAAQQIILDTLNDGPTLVAYAGHGSYQLWRGELLTATEASRLTNREQWPVVAAMSCLNGYFQDPARDSLAEALLLAEGGGAVAVWTSSGMGYAPGQAAVLQAWVRLLFAGGGGEHPMTLGEAAVRAKAATTDMDVRRTWNLLGDPSLRLIQ